MKNSLGINKRPKSTKVIVAMSGGRLFGSRWFNEKSRL